MLPARLGEGAPRRKRIFLLSARTDDPNFRAEQSYEKGKEETYSKKGTIRIDALEYIERTSTVCVYDIKTGASGLSRRRMFEIAKNVYSALPHAKRFIVTEVRPKPW